MLRLRWFLLVAAACMLAVTSTQATPNRKLILIAGPPDPGYVGLATNQTYYQALNLFKTNLDATVPGLTTTIVTNGWPSDISIFNDADAIVLYSDGANDNNHPLMVSNRLYAIALALNRGVSFSTFYRGCDIPDAQGGTEFLDWLGGYLNTNAVPPYGAGDWHSYEQAHWYCHFTNLPTHAITANVPSYMLEDDWFVHFNWRSSPPYATPILRSTDIDHDAYTTNVVYQGTTQTVAWAFERTNGGRGFVFGGGGAFYHTWNHPDGGGPNDWTNIGYNVHLVMNAMKWISKMDVVDSNQTVILPGSSWKYRDTGVMPGAGWTNLVFTDSAWSSGTAPLGYDTTFTKPISTTVGYGGDMANKYVTTYFRKTFQVADAAASSATINVNADDGAVIYVNGTEIGRVRMPAGAVSNATLASATTGSMDEETQWAALQVPAGVLVTGTNLVAVEIHQSTVGSSDIRFDAYVTLQAPQPANQLSNNSTWKYADNGADMGTAWRGASFADTNWPVGTAPLGYGNAGTAVSNALLTVIRYGADPTNKYATTYFRRPIVLSDTSLLNDPVTFYAQVDDGAIVYVNGSVAWTNNMVASGVTYLSYATTKMLDDVSVATFTIPRSMFVNGTNIIAAEVHQFDAGSSDLMFDLWSDGLPSGAAVPTLSQQGALPYGTNQPPSSNAPASSDWTAYDDTAWTASSGQTPSANDITGNFTTNSPHALLGGHLFNATTATQLAAQVTFTTNGVTGMNLLDRAFGPPSGSDAATWFSGKIGTNCAANWSGGTVTMALSGLDASRQYNIVLWSTRGADGEIYSNRFTDIEIAGADAFVNRSSAGTEVSTHLLASDKTRVRSPLAPGLVAQYDNVNPGSDGAVSFSLTAGADTLWPTSSSVNAYLNGFMIQTVPQGSATVTVPDAWKTQYFGTTNVDLNADPDHDGLSNLQEYIAGCAPNNSNSAPILDLRLQGGALNLDFGGVTQRLYSIDYKTNLLGSWQALIADVLGSNATQFVTLTQTNALRYYRFRVRLTP